MDVSRAILDNLMGRDRNKPTDKITQRDHYSNPDVCKSFLVCFCFNTLFPNTTYDQGPCQKRHDTYLKNMFDNDPSRALYQRQYIRQCIHWIQRRLQDVQKKTKQNQSVIDNKSNFPADRPKQILDRILAIDEDIQNLIIQSQKYGQEGKIDDCARCLEQVEKLRDRRKEIELMGSDMTNAQKQQKICLICGAIQTINDTEKRIQTHLEGKIHQGFLKLRHQVQTLKIRLEVLNKMNPEKKQREDYQERKKQQQDRRKEENQKKYQKIKQPQPQRNNQTRLQKEQRQRSDSASRKRRKQRQRSRQRSKQRRERNQDRDRRKDSRDRGRHSRSKERKERKHHRESRQKHRQSREKERSLKDSKEQKKKHKKNRSKSRQKDGQSHY